MKPISYFGAGMSFAAAMANLAYVFSGMTFAPNIPKAPQLVLLLLFLTGLALYLTPFLIRRRFKG